MTSELNRRAWHIRKVSARKLGCGVMEILWGVCLQMAKEALKREAANRQELVITQTWCETRRPKAGLLTRVFARLTNKVCFDI